LAARCVVLDEFLAPQELDALVRSTLEHEGDFQVSEVVSPAQQGVVDYEHRRSRVLMELGEHKNLIVKRIRAVLPNVLRQLVMDEFPIAEVEVQITASNHGDFFHDHSDNAAGNLATRRLTFVYFFHREPRQFEGGELRLHDSRLEGDRHVGTGSCHTIVPRQNQMVFFDSSLLHEITLVECPSRAFADSRFTLNGWFRQ
jgi:SM-20-related protein